MTRKEWGTQVKVALIQKDITQTALADKLGVSRQFVNNIINDTCPTPASETVKRISEELGMDVPEDVKEAGCS